MSELSSSTRDIKTCENWMFYFIKLTKKQYENTIGRCKSGKQIENSRFPFQVLIIYTNCEKVKTTSTYYRLVGY